MLRVLNLHIHRSNVNGLSLNSKHQRKRKCIVRKTVNVYICIELASVFVK